MCSGLQYVFKGGMEIFQMLMWRYHFWRILGYVKELLTEVNCSRLILYLGRKKTYKNLYLTEFVWIYVPHEYACQIGIAWLLVPLLNPHLFYIAVRIRLVLVRLQLARLRQFKSDMLY
jgi:hypothetical protein